MNRREFLKAVSALGFLMANPHLVYASGSKQKELIKLISNEINFQKPAVLPKVIHIFLYGGPSELAGNLTNIEDINLNSQNPYPSYLIPGNSGNVVTKNFFWGNAGGNTMEELISNGNMSIYRTVHRIKDDNKSHPTSIAQNLIGNLDLTKPGYATTLAAILAAYNPFNKDLDQLILPFVSLEGDSTVFKLGEENIPQVLRPIMLSSNFDNPYQRKKNKYLNNEAESMIENLAREMSSAYDLKLKKINDAFSKRKELADFLEANLDPDAIDQNLPTNPNHDPNNPDIDTDDTGKLVYPDTSIGRSVKAAISLAINNPDTVFVSIGYGGWDNHSDAIDGYEDRMTNLMNALRVASKHLRWTNTGNIVINAFGDFGRNVNLNNSFGWDHGNNQNLYTVGGWDIPGRALGKLVGKTERVGNSKVNRQFTKPTADSYQFEPFSIVSTVYKYFGVQNPEILTGEPPINESNDVPNEFKV